MNLSPSAFYELGPLGECNHARTRLLCDVGVSLDGSRWYVACLDCGASGQTAETAELASEAWAELVEFVDVLVVANERQRDRIRMADGVFV